MLYALKRQTCPWSDPPELVYPDKNWLSQAKKDIICSRCKFINRKYYPQPFEVVLSNTPEENLLCTVLEDTGITIWRRDFLETISEYLTNFIMARCLLSEGSVLDDYASCYSSHYIVVRGNRQSRYHVCPDCGTITYRVRPGPEYILKRYLTGGKVYQDAWGNFFFTEDIAWRINLDKWDVNEQNVYIEAISVRENPADGQILPGNTNPCSNEPVTPMKK